MAVAVVALVKHTIKSVFSREKKDLDDALITGYQVYEDIITGCEPRMLFAREFERTITVDAQCFEVTTGVAASGVVGMEVGDNISNGVLDSWTDGINTYLESHCTFLFTTHSNTIGIIREEGRYAVVDSHSRGKDGLMHPDGTSVVLRFSCLEALRDYMSRLATSLDANGKFFELCSVSVSVSQELTGESRY